MFCNVFYQLCFRWIFTIQTYCTLDTIRFYLLRKASSKCILCGWIGARYKIVYIICIIFKLNITFRVKWKFTVDTLFIFSSIHFSTPVYKYAGFVCEYLWNLFTKIPCVVRIPYLHEFNTHFSINNSCKQFLHFIYFIT